MKESVLVIGGGIAGPAARELARNKIPVTVIEAKNRFGGRIHTIYEKKFRLNLALNLFMAKAGR